MSFTEEEKKQQAINKSKSHIISEANAALTINSIHKESLHISTLITELSESFIRVKNDNFLEVEAMLLSQAHTLNVFFHHALSQASQMSMSNQIQTFSDLAMKAQNNCRKTLLALAEIRNPKRATFIKQQNNAINQQVNNNPENLKKPANEVLCEDHNAQLDERSTETSITTHTTLETLETIDRR